MASISSTSTVSAQKSAQISTDNRSKSCDTVCTTSSSCFFKRRKPMNPLAYSLRPIHHKTNANSVKQRVMSAKMLKVRQLQSQLNDANFHLAEVVRENQTLKTLQKRQDKALSKYENANADLPRLLHSHEEEIKVLTEKNRNLRKNVKDFAEQLKQREEELSKAKEQLSHLEKLNKDKNLTERGKLMEKMEYLKVDLQRSEEQVSTLNRKLVLESKISKQRLNAEIVKHKQCQKEMLHALEEIDRLSGLLDAKENMIRPRNPKFNKLQNRDSMSMVTLRHYQTPNRTSSSDRLTILKNSLQTPVTEVKLEPLVNGSQIGLDSMSKKNYDGFKAPIENIKQRLSSGSKVPRQDANDLSNHSSDVSLESRENSAGSLTSRPNSSLKLEKLPAVQENQRVRGKMKREKENRPDENDGAEEKLEQNGSDGENVGLDGNEDEEIVVRYDRKEDHNSVVSLEDLRRPINYRDQNTLEEIQKEVNFGQETENQSENDSDEDVVNMIQRMKKEKQEETKMLRKPPNSKRKNSDDSSKTISLDSQKSEEENIERIAETLDAAIQRAAENSKEEFDKKLGNYCSEVLSSVKNCSKVIKSHKEGLESSKQDTNALMQTLKRTEKVESKLKKSFFNMDDDMSFVNEILNEEYKFQAENKNQNLSTLNNNSNLEKKSLVNVDNKKKLLATLRAIDNGDSVDSLEEHKHGNFLSERFGNVAH